MRYAWSIRKEDRVSFLEQLFASRGIDSKDWDVFLDPQWERDIHDPFLFTHMRGAVERVLHAIQSKERIVIHGDYDADGICGVTILMEALRIVASALSLPLEVEAFLPHRERDGYGVASHSIERFAKLGTQVLITVDCGISNATELSDAHAKGMDVIICDHHQLGEHIPEHAYIIHPLAPNETYPNTYLCGAGVAFKFASALLTHARDQGIAIKPGVERWMLDLVAIATVTDVVPLLGENRALETFGLKVLNKTRRPGLLRIIEQAGLTLGSITATDIGFRIGPRLNAAGRIREARLGFEALNESDPSRASELALELELINRERQRLSDAAFKEALRQVDPQHFVHVLWSQTWAPGIVGLVAGKIASQTNKSAFVLTESEGKYLGSGRSAQGLHLVEAMHACGNVFVKSGGHPEACGLTIANVELIQFFQERVNEYAREQQGTGHELPELFIDAVVDFKDIDWTMLETIERFAPFGKGNPEPVFVCKRVPVQAIRLIGKDESHIKLRLGKEKSFSAIGFGMGQRASELKIGSEIDIAFHLQVNEWNGVRSLQFQLVDFRNDI